MTNEDEFLYWANAILRKVCPVLEIGEIYQKKTISKWISRNNYVSVFSLLTSSLLNDEIPFDSKVSVGFVLSLDCLDDLDDQEIAKVLAFIKNAKYGCLLAIRTFEYGVTGNEYSIQEWKDILIQLGSVIHVYDSMHFSLFAVIKKLK